MATVGEAYPGPLGERRGRRGGRIDRISCRHCGEVVRLDPRKMRVSGTDVALRCDTCSRDMPARFSDPAWHQPTPVAAAPTAVRARRGWRRHA